MSLPPLLILTDRAQLPPGTTLVEHVEKCVQAGATHVVLRELDLSTAERAALAAQLAEVGATVIAAHTPLSGSVGVHQASTAMGPVTGFVGRSCHDTADVQRAAADECAYATLGPFALTTSKPGYGPPLAPSVYADLPIPTYALGGITAANASDAIDAGAYGVAVMGAIMRTRAPKALVRDLLELVS